MQYSRMESIVVKRPANNTVFRGESGQNSTKTANSGHETGLYYFGARYLDPKTSRWISADPAMGEYIPSPGQNKINFLVWVGFTTS